MYQSDGSIGTKAADERDVTCFRRRPDVLILAVPVEAMVASVAAGGDERWSVVRSSEEPKHVAHCE